MYATYAARASSPRWPPVDRLRQNAYIESFNSRFRDEFLNLEVFGSLLEAKMLGEEHRYKYNHQRPHSSLGDLTPAEFASRCPSPLRPPASTPKDSANQLQPQLS